MGNQPPTSEPIARTRHWTCSPELLERTANGPSLGARGDSLLSDSEENQAQTQPNDMDTSAVQTVECLLNTDTALRDFATGASYHRGTATLSSVGMPPRDAPVTPTTNCAILHATATLAATIATGDQEAIAFAEQAVAEAKHEMQNAEAAWSQDKDLDFETQFLVFRLGLIELELELEKPDADSLQAATDSQLHIGWTPDSDSSSRSSEKPKGIDDLSDLPRVYPSGAFGQMMSF